MEVRVEKTTFPYFRWWSRGDSFSVLHGQGCFRQDEVDDQDFLERRFLFFGLKVYRKEYVVASEGYDLHNRIYITVSATRFDTTVMET